MLRTTETGGASIFTAHIFIFKVIFLLEQYYKVFVCVCVFFPCRVAVWVFASTLWICHFRRYVHVCVGGEAVFCSLLTLQGVFVSSCVCKCKEKIFSSSASVFLYLCVCRGPCAWVEGQVAMFNQ